MVSERTVQTQVCYGLSPFFLLCCSVIIKVSSWWWQQVKKPSCGPRYHRLHVQPTNNKIIEKMVSMKMSNCKNKINPHHSYCIFTNLSNVQSRRWKTDEGTLFHGANQKNSTRGFKINSLAKDKCKFGVKMEIFKLWHHMISLSYFWCIKKMGDWTVQSKSSDGYKKFFIIHFSE